jgi:diguanylate cyclase (GGDEF)-like protein
MTPLRLLLIEDSEHDATLVEYELSRAGYVVTSKRVDTPETLVAALAEGPWDIAVADFTMPRFSGTAALTLLRQHNTDMPFIFVSGTIGEDAAVDAMKTGAHDYIMKGNLKRLVPAVERELREAAGRVSRKRAEARLAYLAYHDPLTDLPNRLLLQDRLQQGLLNAHRAGDSLALIVLDLDAFKAINDSLGHQAGDRVLQVIAGRLRAHLREIDTVARLGGDEFAILLPRTDSEGATLVARKLLAELRAPLELDGHAFVLGGSLGIASCPQDGVKADLLLQKADVAMYVAKAGGFGYAVYAEDRDRPAHQRLGLMTEIIDGIARREFSLHYQPVVHLQSGATVYLEGLARWDHPARGAILPAEFVPFAEQISLIDPLTTLLLEQALADWSRPSPTPPPIPVAVNLSPRSLREADFPDRVAALLQAHRAAPGALVLEITENVLLSDASRAISSLSRLREMGVRLALDDFGAGYSSLSYLRRLPVDLLKIDRSFVTGMAHDDAIVRSTIDLAHDLGLEVIAEGVETPEARDRLAALGCDAAQGRFIAEPAPPAEIRRWLARRQSGL